MTAPDFAGTLAKLRRDNNLTALAEEWVARREQDPGLTESLGRTRDGASDDAAGPGTEGLWVVGLVADAGNIKGLLDQLPPHIPGSSNTVPVDAVFWRHCIILPGVTMPHPRRNIAYAVSTFARPDDTGARPGVRRLADGCDMHERSVRRHMELLRRAGLLTLSEPARSAGRGGGAGRAAVHLLTWPEDWRRLRWLT